MGLTEEQAPFTEPYAKSGNPNGFRSKGQTALAVKRALAHLGFMDWAPEAWDEHWNEKVNSAAAEWKRKRGLIPANSADGSWGKKSHDVMRSAWYGSDKMPAFDGESQRLLKQEKGQYEPDDPPTVVPNLGPVWGGGISVLQHDLTHATSGLPLYPAFDDAFEQGREIIAPENLKVTSSSSSNPGEAFYATGDSKIKYWFGHLDRTHNAGKTFKKGALVGCVGPNDVGGGPHTHVGINTEALGGQGTQLKHHTDYTHGAPCVGDQLEDLL